MIGGVLLLATAQTATPAVAPPLAEALAQGAGVCERSLYSGAFNLPSNATLYMNIPSEQAGVKPIATIPDLVERFAKTQPLGRVAQVQSATKIHADKGEVWTIFYQDFPACELMVTQGQDVPSLGVALIKKLDEEDNWDITRAAPSTDQMPLARYVLTKSVPLSANPNYVSQLTVEWFTASSSNEDGIQLSMSFIAGTRKQPSN